MKTKVFLFVSLFITILFTACTPTSNNIRERIQLSGTWELRLDTAGTGISEAWFNQKFPDQLQLPGTTDTNQKGFANEKKDETTYLTRNYTYFGKAWYKKQVTIPTNWEGKHIELTLERTKPTHVWIDGKAAGTNDNISTRQIYDLTEFLTPGTHDIVIMVDNGQSVPQQLLSSSHAYTESTQTNWNGIIGEMFLEAADQLHIQAIQVYPDAQKKSISVKINIADPETIADNGKIELSAQAWNTTKKHTVKKASFDIEKGKSEYFFEYPLGDNALLWSEFDPALYALEVSIKDHDNQKVNFGLRDFKAEGTQFTINNELTFLRGKHDACVFPLTAHVPMDVDSWRHYFQVCKEYGINHVRFHSWCPPKACFEAADIEGIYLQPELPFWGSLTRSEDYLSSFLMKEGINIQNEFGNHASFVLFALGNELWGDLDLMKEFTNTFREVDNRHLYAFGSNNFLGFEGQIPGEDFLVTCRIGGANDYSTHTRGSFSFADADEGGYINNTYPNSVMNFEGAIAGCTVPVISHETGQFQVYPNYNEMTKYTGALRPDNFEVFRQRLEKAGMSDQTEDFFKASGKWSAMLYKADIEMDLRTKGFGGFQLLDLQDYPGQGSAYVGILDAFMDSKGLITPEEWREFCSNVVPLFVTEKFCWTNSETLSGTIKIANYSNISLKGKTISWTLKNKADEHIDSGELNIASTEKGLIDAGTITPSISGISQSEAVMLEINIAGTEYKNRYPLWIYPDADLHKSVETTYISKKLDDHMVSELKSGKSVLWFPQKEDYEKQTVGALFQTDYWNYRMFKSICDRIGKPASPGTLGILTNPEHPIFKDFPTDFHTNWQWYSIIKQSYPFILDRMPADYRPIVQVIDNVERNHKLGLVFEFNVDGGKLLVCMANLDVVNDKPEVVHFYNSIINYIHSDAFQPTTRISSQALYNLFSAEVKSDKIETLENISYN